MSSLPHNLYRADQVRALDRAAIEQHNLPGSVLMERAGAAAFLAMQEAWPQARRIVVLCGTGNNGGDGFVLARHAHQDGLEVTAYQVGDGGSIAGEAFAALQRLQGAGVDPSPWESPTVTEDLARADVVVDALLGTGLNGVVEGQWREVIEAVTAAGRPVLALDIPSGLEADTGQVLGVAVRAALTVTFIGLKRGLSTGAGPEYCGVLRFDDLRVPADVYAQQSPAAARLDLAHLQRALARRRRDAHKGDFGHVLVIGGDHGMNGAARMAAEAALRVGAGRVSVATRGTHAALLSTVRPEIMSHGIESAKALGPLLERASVIAIGPGLGQSSWARELLGRVLEQTVPLVVDADGLNLLAEEPARREQWVLTPHPGEAARLLGCTVGAVQDDRFAAAASLAESFGGVCVLKGAGTLVHGGPHAGSEGPPVGVCMAGNPGMATGGMGDVLTGIIAGLLGQGLGTVEAARLGVCLHAAAGDAAAKAGERGLLAGDLMSWVRRLANPGDQSAPFAPAG